MPWILLQAKSMVAINSYEYYYVQSENSIMRNEEEEKNRKKLQDKLKHYDDSMKRLEKIDLEQVTKENMAIYMTNSLLSVVPELTGKIKKWLENELKKRKIAKNIKIRNFKQLIKRILLEIKY